MEFLFPPFCYLKFDTTASITVSWTIIIVRVKICLLEVDDFRLGVVPRTVVVVVEESPLIGVHVVETVGVILHLGDILVQEDEEVTIPNMKILVLSTVQVCIPIGISVILLNIVINNIIIVLKIVEQDMALIHAWMILPTGKQNHHMDLVEIILITGRMLTLEGKD